MFSAEHKTKSMTCSPKYSFALKRLHLDIHAKKQQNNFENIYKTIPKNTCSKVLISNEVNNLQIVIEIDLIDEIRTFIKD